MKIMWFKRFKITKKMYLEIGYCYYDWALGLHLDIANCVLIFSILCFFVCLKYREK